MEAKKIKPAKGAVPNHILPNIPDFYSIENVCDKYTITAED